MTEGEALLEVLDVPVYTTDTEGRLTFFNSAAVRFWGHAPKLGDLWCGSWRLYYPDGRALPHDQCPMAIALKEGRALRGVEAIAERPDGTRVPFMPAPSLLRDADGKVTGAINFLMDMSHRHDAQAELAHLAAIVSSSDDAIISKRLDGIITSWNDGARRIFDYTAEEMVGQSILRLIPPDLVDEEKRIIAQLSRGERIEHYETIRVAKNGRRVAISLTVSPLRDSHGVVVGASKVARDISERRRAEETRRLLVDELNHRIKNTLATVQAIASQTLRRAKNPAEFVAGFSGRVQALARANALLTASTFQAADLRQLVRDQLLIGAADDQRISYAGPSVELEGQSAMHLALVLHELGTNARKHGALSTMGGLVSVTWEVRTDNGPALLLTWEERGGPVVSAPKTHGFGTTLIEQSLQAHNGSAAMRYMESGVTCTINLPLRPADSALGDSLWSSEAAPAAPAEDTDRSRIAGKRVLVVEDEALIAMVLSDYLADCGCTVVGPARSLEQAKRMVAETEFDAVLLDANLAGRPVDEIAAAVRKKGAPFAFVTGYGREALPQGFQDSVIVEKPFTPDQVASALERVLRADPKVVPLRRLPRI